MVSNPPRNEKSTIQYIRQNMQLFYGPGGRVLRHSELYNYVQLLESFGLKSDTDFDISA